MDMSLLKAILKDLRGNTTIIFALAVVPLILGAGAAVDMIRANNTQTVLQGAADAAAVAGAASGKTSKADLMAIVTEYVNANGTPKVLDSVSTLDSVLDSKNRTFSVTIKGQMKTSLMAVAGLSSMDIGAFSQVGMANEGMEIALVLDNTGSMNDSNRLPSLKASAKQLVDEVFKAAGNNYVKIGVVPFSEYVDVGMGNRNASWINVPADTSTTTNQCWDTYPNATKSNCRMETSTWSMDGVPQTSTYEVCDWNYGAAVSQCGPVTNSLTWNGCVGSRGVATDTTIGDPATKYPGVQNVNCPIELLPLSSDRLAVDAKIDAMTGVGNTYIPAGLVWGWNLLDPNQPFTEAKSKSWMKDHGGTKALVLMTDGDNTLTPTYPYHNPDGGNTAVANAKVTELCDNIKGTGITLYTVSLMVTNPVSKAMLINCASDGSKAFTADDPASLAEAFRNITESLLAMRFVK
jgi:Flp pilus assembly protein TadG